MKLNMNLCEIMYQYAQVRCQTQEERNAVKQVSQKNLISWGLLEKSEGRIVPTNGFMLLTENMLPSATIQCAVFKGTNRAVFLDRKEYEEFYLNNDFDMTESKLKFDFGSNVVYTDYDTFIQKVAYAIKSL